MIPIELSQQESYILHNEELIEESKRLVAEIREIELSPPNNQSQSTNGEDDALKDYVHLMGESFIQSEVPVIVKDADEEKKRIKKWLGVDVPDGFFDFGNLKKKIQFLNNSSVPDGTQEELFKYQKYESLAYNLCLLEIRDIYLDSFEGMYFFPLAIQNISSVEDSNLRIVVKVEKGKLVDPAVDLITEELQGVQGKICRDEDENNGIGLIDELFGLEEDGNIHIEDNGFSYDFKPRIPVPTSQGLMMPGKDEDDYKRELEDYIATTNSRDYYEFEVKSLRPGECKWLSEGMLIVPEDDAIKLTYQIHSSHSTGDLSGTLEYKRH